MALADRTHVSRRYQRAIRIDTDLGDPAALDGFICPRSSAEVLETMARHVAESGQGAFTWTGPYGSGKSSLAVALSAALNGDKALRRHAASSPRPGHDGASGKGVAASDAGLAHPSRGRSARPSRTGDGRGDPCGGFVGRQGAAGLDGATRNRHA